MANFSIPTDAFSPERAPLWRPALAFGLGAFLVRSEVLPPFWALAIGAGALLWLALGWQKALLLALLVGAALAAVDLLRLAALQQIDDDWLTSVHWIEGRIVEVSPTSWGAAVVLDEVRRADGARLFGRIRLFARTSKLAEGMRIAVRVRLRRPFNRGNPGAFDYRAWCFDRGIVVLGSMRGVPRILSPPSWLGSWRHQLRKAIAGLDEEARGIVHAALLGGRGWIAPGQNDRFAAAGIAHLFAISGVHIGAAAMMFAALAGVLVRLWPVVLIYGSARWAAFFAGVIGAWGYALLAGMPPSAVRAAIMFTIGALAWALGERRRGINALAAAWIVIVAFDPSAVASLSLWLSFLATLGLLLMPRLRRPVLAGAVATLGAQAATWPVSWSVFGWLAPWAWLANLGAAPLFWRCLRRCCLRRLQRPLAGMKGCTPSCGWPHGLRVGWIAGPALSLRCRQRAFGLRRRHC